MNYLQKGSNFDGEMEKPILNEKVSLLAGRNRNSQLSIRCTKKKTQK